MLQIDSVRGLGNIKFISKCEVNLTSGFQDIAFKSNILYTVHCYSSNWCGSHLGFRRMPKLYCVRSLSGIKVISKCEFNLTSSFQDIAFTSICVRTVGRIGPFQNNPFFRRAYKTYLIFDNYRNFSGGLFKNFQAPNLFVFSICYLWVLTYTLFTLSLTRPSPKLSSPVWPWPGEPPDLHWLGKSCIVGEISHVHLASPNFTLNYI